MIYHTVLEEPNRERWYTGWESQECFNRFKAEHPETTVVAEGIGKEEALELARPTVEKKPRGLSPQALTVLLAAQALGVPLP